MDAIIPLFSNISWMVFQNFILRLVDMILTTFSNALANVMGTANSVLVDPALITVIAYVQGLAITFVSIVVGLEALHNWILFQSGDSQANPKDVFLRMVKSVAIITCGPWIVHQVYYWGTEVAVEVASLTNVQYAAVNNVSAAIATMASPFLVAIGMLIGIVIMALIFIQAFVRSAELAVLAVTGPIMALGILRSTSGLFQTWWKELIVLSMTQALQILLLKMAFASFTNFNSMADPFFSVFKFIGFLWVCYKTPAVLKQFAYSSGVGHALGGTAQSAGTMYMIRRMVTKV